MNSVDLVNGPCRVESPPDSTRRVGVLSLPAEIRIAILEYAFEDSIACGGCMIQGDTGGIYLDETYTASAALRPLLTCRHFYHDGNLPAFQRTTFVVSPNAFFHIPDRLSILHSKQISAIRSMAFVADARHFRTLVEWGEHPFGIPGLHLDTLTIALHRSSVWPHLFDHTAEMVGLLRKLRGVEQVEFVRNGAPAKGSFRTWYNRLVGLIMKVDHRERYDRAPPALESTWWTWEYRPLAQSFRLRARPPKPLVDEESYMRQIAPLMEELRVSMEEEEG